MDLGEERSTRNGRRLVLSKREEVSEELVKEFEESQTDIFDGNIVSKESELNDLSEVDEDKFMQDLLGSNDWSVPDSFEDKNEPRKHVVLDAVKKLEETERRLESAKTPKDYFDVGNDKGRVEGMIEGYVMAMFNMGADLDIVSRKMVLTFNLTQVKAEDYLRQFYEKRNIEFEEV